VGINNIFFINRIFSGTHWNFYTVQTITN